LEGIAMEDFGIFYGPFVYFTANCYILWSFGTFCGLFGTFFPVLVCCIKKNLATLLHTGFSTQSCAAKTHRHPLPKRECNPRANG
jgi:hypothetical protein